MRWVAVVLTACGRLGFEPTTSIPIDAPRADAPSTAKTTTIPAIADTYVSQDLEGGDERPNNFGTEDRMKIKQGEEHGLVKFDVGNVPGTVFSADLSLFVTSPPASGAATIGVFPLSEDWIEGTQQGTPGKCNWTLRTEVLAWTTPGAAPPGSASTMVTSFAASASGRVEVGLPPSLVQQWRDAPATNFGVLLMVINDESIDVGTRESVQAERPSLVVTYVP